jgi:hypothetical protein
MELQTARLSGCALAAGKASSSRREISIGEE